METHLGLCSECEGKVKAIRSENLVEVAIETTPNLGVPRDLFSLILDKISDDKLSIVLMIQIIFDSFLHILHRTG